MLKTGQSKEKQKIESNLYDCKQVAKMTMLLVISVLAIAFQSCNQEAVEVKDVDVKTEYPEYFLLRPELEKSFGYSHAVRIGDDLKISGAVSRDDKGVIVAPGNMELQMKNCYSDLEKILKHYGYTFEDVVVENVFTTNIKDFIHVSGF